MARAAQRVVNLLASEIDRKARRERDLRATRVLGRDTDGTLLLDLLEGECVLRGDTRPAEVGQVLRLPSTPAFLSRGSAGVGAVVLSGEDRGVWVESLEPRSWPRGQETAVAVTGRGFRSGETVIEALLAPESTELHPHVTVLSLDVHSPTSATLVVSVAPSAPLASGLPIAYDNPGSAV